MSLLKYFKNSEKASALDPFNVCEAMKNDLPNNITGTNWKRFKKVYKSLGRTRKNEQFMPRKKSQSMQ